MLDMALGIAAGAVLIGLHQMWLLPHRWRLVRLRFHRAQFFELADRLVDSDEISDEMLERLRVLVGQMDSREEFARLVAAVKAVNGEIRASGFIRGTEIVSVDWGALIYHYVLAVSYAKLVQGIVLRARLAGLLSPGPAAYNVDVVDRRAHATPFQAA